LWDGPAFRHGIISGSSILAVNGRKFSLDILKDRIAATASGDALRLTIEAGRRVSEIAFDYAGGLRFAHLAAIADGPRRLDQILSPR
jgi:predicted metalloprotease with PDZ domain